MTRRSPASATQRKQRGAPTATDAQGQRQNRARADQDERERRFVAEYFANGLQGVKAAISAGYSENYATACSMASRLLRRPSVIKLIERERAKEGDASGERKRRMVEALEREAFADVRRLFDDEGNLSKITRLDDETASLIAGIEVNEVAIGENAMSITRKVKLKDQHKARELLAKLDGTLVDRTDVTSGGKPIEVVEIATFTPKPKQRKAA